ncbi:MAG: radical SAM protein [Syntrophobacterales bacterium]|nr:radical SAM protein [Syntrophobacterales bacterium]
MESVCIAYADGCSRAETEIELLGQYFEANGFKLKERIENAELVLVSACGFDLCSEKTSIKLLRKAFKKKGEKARFVVTGCLSAINREIIVETFGDQALLLPARSLGKLDELISAKVPFKKIIEKGDFSRSLVKTDVKLRKEQAESILEFPQSYNLKAKRTFSSFERFMAALLLTRTKIDDLIAHFPKCLQLQFIRQSHHLVPSLLLSRGCQGQCTYCGIPSAVGPLKSLPLERIADNFRSILAQGNRVIGLVATDVGSYGQDNGSSVVELFQRLFAFDEKFQLIINDFNPRWLVEYSDDLIDLFAANADKIDYILMPIQSGSEKILSLMKRRHTAYEVREHMLALKKAVPGIHIGTHVMVGFPGETEEDFNATLDFLKTINFYYMKVFKYDDRPRIEAAKLPDKVPEKIKRRRLLKLIREFHELVK